MRAEEIRVLRVITRLNIGGPAREVGALCRLAEGHGVRTVLAAGRPSTREGDEFDRLDTGSAAKVRIPSLARRLDARRDLAALWALARVIRRFRPDVVHTHLSKAGTLGRIAARTLGVPVVCHTYHGHVLSGHFGSKTSRLISLAEWILGRISDAVVALGPAGAAELRRLGIGSRVAIVPPGFERERLARLAGEDPVACRRRLGIPDDRPVLLALGRLAYVKGVDLLLEATARLAREGIRPHLLLAGDGPDRADLEHRAARPGLDGIVRFLGWRTDLATLFGAADLLVLPSRSEGYPHVVVEARAAGLAVVASAVGEIPSMLAAADSAFLVAPGRGDALHEMLRTLLANEAWLSARRARPRPRPAFPDTEATMVARTCSLYRELLGAREPGREDGGGP